MGWTGRWVAAAAAAAVVLGAAACGGDGDAAAGAPSPEELCALIGADDLAEVAAARDVRAEAGGSTAPDGCVFSYRVDGERGTTNLFVQMVPARVIGDARGEEALGAAVRRADAGDPEPLPGLGVPSARVSPGFGSLVFALAGEGRVASFLFDSDLALAGQAELTRRALARLDAPGDG